MRQAKAQPDEVEDSSACYHCTATAQPCTAQLCTVLLHSHSAALHGAALHGAALHSAALHSAGAAAQATAAASHADCPSWLMSRSLHSPARPAVVPWLHGSPKTLSFHLHPPGLASSGPRSFPPAASPRGTAPTPAPSSGPAVRPTPSGQLPGRSWWRPPQQPAGGHKQTGRGVTMYR